MPNGRCWATTWWYRRDVDRKEQKSKMSTIDKRRETLRLFVLSLLVLAGNSSANAQVQPTLPQSGSRTFYDASGRISGTASTSGNARWVKCP